jgi:hypothetical protein
MKLKHNKKRNTAFIYEVLISEVSKASMHELHERKLAALDILKKYFYKGSTLKRELEVYRSFEGLQDNNQQLIEKIISEAKTFMEKIDTDGAYEQQTELINEINKDLGHSVWGNFVGSYRKLATINQVLSGASSPKKQVFVEQKLVNLLTKQEEENKQQFPAINKLAMKTFLNKFNEKYSDSLNESQKRLLKEYITSYKDDGAEFKMFLYEEVGRLKGALKESIESGTSPDKLSLVLEKVESYQNKKIDKKAVTEIIKIQSLVSELNNGD